MSMVTGFSSLNVSVAPPLHMIHENGETPSTYVQFGNHEEGRASSKEPLQITKRADSAVFTISQPLSSHHSPTLTKTADAFVATWHEDITTYSQTIGLYARRIDTAAGLGPATLLLSGKKGQLCTTVIGRGDELLVVWQDEVARELRARRFSVTTSLITPVTPVWVIDFASNSGTSTTCGNYRSLSITLVNDGGYAVAWSHQYQLPYLRVFNMNDVPVGPVVNLGSSISYVNLAWDGSSLMATYLQSNSVRMAAFDASGTLTKAPFTVSGGTTVETVAAPIAVSFDGGFWAQWNGDYVSGPTPPPLYGRVVRANGTFGTNPVEMAPVASQTGAVVTSLNSGFVAMWFNPYLLYVQTYRYDAAAYGAVKTVDPYDLPGSPSIEAISNRLCITWRPCCGTYSGYLLGKIIDLPTLPTLSPTSSPTLEPTPFPTLKPTLEPTPFPSLEPTPLPSALPTNSPTSFLSPLPTTLTSLPDSATVWMPESTSSSAPKDGGLAAVAVVGGFLLLLVAGVSFYLGRRKQRPTVQEVQEPTEASGAYDSIGLRRITRGYDLPPVRKESRLSVSSVGYDDIDITVPTPAAPPGYDDIDITSSKSAVPVGYHSIEVLRSPPAQYGSLQLSQLPAGARTYQPHSDQRRSRRHSQRVSKRSLYAPD